MNKPNAVVGLLFVLLGSSLAPAPAQQADKALKPAEIKELAKNLQAWRNFPEYPASDKEEKKKHQAEDRFRKSVEKIDKSYGDTDILSFTSSWTEVFKKLSVDKLPKAPAGRGRVKVEKVSQRARGEEFGFEYGLYIPRKYNPKQAWPLIVALHDKGTTGDKYLKEVWVNPKRLPKEILENFIVVAPTIGDKTVGKVKRHQKRIEFLDRLHRGGIALCMLDVLRKFNVDTNRIYLEGTGTGGTAAVEIAKMQTKWFAGVASRNGLPVTEREGAFPNYMGQAPVWMITRTGEDSMFASDKGKGTKVALEDLQKSKGVPLTIKEYDPLPDRRAKRLALGTQKSDPVHDATKEVAEFFLTQKRKLFPSELRYITYDSRNFKQASWFILDSANASPTDKTTAEIWGKVDREKNTIEFTATNVESFRLYLNDVLVDLDRPITITLNGKEVMKKEVERSLDYLLAYNKVNVHDPELIVVGDVRINVPLEDEAGNGDKGEETGDGK